MRLMLLAWPPLAAAPVWADDRAVDYLRDIKPVLQERCYACHGALKERSGLRADTAKSLLDGGDSGPAVVPGRSEESLLVARVTGAGGVRRMPPEGEPLTAQQVGLLRRWIDQGAPLPKHEEPEPDPQAHWAFQPPTRPPVPKVHNAAWVRNPIDAFLAAEHERLGLQPVPPAANHVLLRRLYLDLIGLPPTGGQWQAFHGDSSADAYERVVERLLNSPEHGQRWGRHWMDIWRYSDWSGENKNLVRGSPKHIWRWRDWIVESLNRDKGYDRMILEMLAGDELAPANPDIVRATGFLARNWYEFNRNVWLDDTVEHTAKAFLGLTLSCARCHDHKFDPLSQREYYAWRAIFEPHDVRIDAVPAQPDTALDGLPRVYDAQPAAPTYLLIRGEETRPDKRRSIAPGVPDALGGQFEVRPVSLPLQAYYPAVQAESCQELLRRAEADVASAQAALGAARSAERPADGTVPLAELKLAAAQAELTALQARIAAERVKYARVAGFEPGAAEVGDASRYDELAAAAAAADRMAVLRKAELAVLQSEQKLASARRLAEGAQDARKARASVTAAEREMQRMRKELAAAKAALARTDSGYRPLGPQTPPTSTGRRLALARWITDPRNPLTARVAVNHVWLRHFGEPLVATVDDFGRRASRPRLAALLDWLAVELVESGWSLKHLHRLIVTSNAYRLASTTREAPAGNAAIDPENRWLWRMNSRRAEAEVIRDSVLHVAGNLDRSLGGPEIPLDQGETSRRRSLYFRHAHERQIPFLEAFDGADVTECYRRSVTVVPQQALALANSALPYEQSRELARKLAADGAGVTDAAFVRLAFEHLLTRPPTAAERDRCLGFLKEQGEQAEADSVRRASLLHALMNHNDFLTIR
jgi:hypothetical protein